LNLLQEKLLIFRSKTGDEKAGQILIDEHYMSVYRFLYKLSSNKELAQDLTQDTFCKVWQSLHKFHGKSRFQSWLYRISHNLFIDHCRKDRTICEEDYYSIYYFHEDNKIKNEDKQLVISKIDELSPKLKVIIVLHYFNEMTHNEISFILQIPIGTVKSRLNAGLSQLRKTLSTGIDYEK